MNYLIDRRLNGRNKSAVNRERFIRRYKDHIRRSVKGMIAERSITDMAKGGDVKVPAKDISEPGFRYGAGGDWEFVHPGNKEFVRGDKIPRPEGGGGGSGGGEAGSGEAVDDFVFTLSREEFLNIFFEDLELPNLVRTTLAELKNSNWKRAGITTSGSPNQINLLRTMRNSFGRRLALKRPTLADVKALEEEIAALEAENRGDERLVALKVELERLNRKRKWVAFIDPLDVRFNAFVEQPQPTSRAVMFCLMDVSGSMGEREKDLAKRFFVLLHLFLKRRYEKVDIVFIRHTHDAQEVDEETFFYSRQSGGTIVSTALEKMLEIQKERYATADWNIYAAQASDGYTQSGDAKRCVELLNEEIMPICQYYAYIEILDEREMEVFSSEEAGAELWRAYRGVAEEWKNFATKRIAKPSDIFPVFHELFRRQEA